MERILTILRTLSAMPGVSGDEGRVANEIKKLCTYDTCYEDSLGNLICIKGNDEKPSIMFEAHMDEVGFMVKHIDDNGYIFCEPIGGIDPKSVIGSEVIVHGTSPIHGIVSNTPPHIKKNNESVPSINDLPIDTGIESDVLKKSVRLGDRITYHMPLRTLSSSKVSSKALDNRAGCAILCYASQFFSDDASVAFVFSSQEEVGARGPIPVVKSLNPKMALSVDTTHGDMQGVPTHLTRKLGSGPIIGIGPNIHPMISSKLIEVANSASIAYTTKAYARPTPSNLRSIQAYGSPGGLLSIPTRYLHTPTEVADIHDMKAASSLIEEFFNAVDDTFMEGLSCY